MLVLEREAKRPGDWVLCDPPTISLQDVNRHRRRCERKAVEDETGRVNSVTPPEVKFDVEEYLCHLR